MRLCAFLSEQIFALKHLKHQNMNFDVQHPREEKPWILQTFDDLPHIWTFQERINRKCPRINLTGHCYTLAGRVQLVRVGWGAGCNRSPDSELSPNSHGRSTKTSPGNHQQLLRLFSLLARTKISRRNVETFFARHLLLFIWQSNNVEPLPNPKYSCWCVKSYASIPKT